MCSLHKHPSTLCPTKFARQLCLSSTSCRARKRPETSKQSSTTVSGHGPQSVPHSDSSNELSCAYRAPSFHEEYLMKQQFHPIYHRAIPQWAGGTPSLSSHKELEVLGRLWSISKVPSKLQAALVMPWTQMPMLLLCFQTVRASSRD